MTVPCPIKLAPHACINRRVVGHDVCGAVDMANDARAQCFGAHVGNAERTDLAVALDQRQNGSFLRNMVFAIGRFTAHKRLVDFDDFVFAAQAAKHFALTHCLANAMG